MHYEDKPKLAHPRGVGIGREKGVTVGSELTGGRSTLGYGSGDVAPLRGSNERRGGLA